VPGIVNIFLSWSGTRGRSVAEALNDWLPGLHREWQTWVSSRQKRGTDWRAALFEHINAADASLLCLTCDSIESRWLAFEAGLLSRRTNTPLAIYGLDIEPDELSGTPLVRMPLFSATEAGTHQLIRTLNAVLPEPVTQRDLEVLVTESWPRLEFHLQNVPPLETRPFSLFVMISGVVARYEFEAPTDRPWAEVLGLVRHALTDQYGAPDTDLSKVEYFDLDEKKWIDAPRRLSGVKTTRLVAVHPAIIEELGGKRGLVEVTLVFRLDQHPREARANALIRRDLQDLAREQDAYREKRGMYASHLDTLEFFTATDVSIEIVEATEAGWCAVGTHKDLRWHLGIRCGTTQRFSEKANAAIFAV
jgi:TIR domain